MRLGRLTSGITTITLGLLLAACGGGASTNGAAASHAGSGGTTNAATAAAVPARTGLPARPVCDVFSTSWVSNLIGVPVYSSNDVDILAGAQPTVCFYYTDRRQVASVEIHWMTVRDAAWDQQLAGLGTAESGGLKTTSTSYPELGPDAIKGTSQSDTVSTISYDVLLKQQDLALEISDMSVPSVGDAAFLKLTKAVIQAVSKL